MATGWHIFLHHLLFNSMQGHSNAFSGVREFWKTGWCSGRRVHLGFSNGTEVPRRPNKSMVGTVNRHMPLKMLTRIPQDGGVGERQGGPAPGTGSRGVKNSSTAGIRDHTSWAAHSSAYSTLLLPSSVRSVTASYHLFVLLSAPLDNRLLSRRSFCYWLLCISERSTS